MSPALHPSAQACQRLGIALQGGLPGAERLRDDPTLQSLLQRQANSGRLVTAMCVADDATLPCALELQTSLGIQLHLQQQHSSG